MPISAQYHSIAERGLKLYALTKDPLTLSAAKILLQARTKRPTAPEKTALAMLQKQLAAYETLYLDKLV